MTRFTILLIDLLVLILLLYRQCKTRQVRKTPPIKLSIVLIAYGLYSLVSYFDYNAITMTSLLSILASLLFLAAGLGAVRAYTVKLWKEGDDIFRKGTWLTVLLWIVSITLHLTIDRIGQTGESTLLIYYGITLAVQGLVVQHRARQSFQSILR